MLYIHGGIYVDIKVVLLASLNDIIPIDASFIALKDKCHGLGYDGYIWTTPLTSKPNHPFFKKIIDMIVDNCDKGFYGNDSLCPTGPGLLGKTINLSLNRDENSPHVPGKYCIEGIKYELWPIPDFKNNVAYTPQGDLFFQCEYTDYRKELYSNLSNDLSKDYQLCWFFDKFYTHGKVCRPNNSEHDSREIFSKVRAGFMQKLYKNGNKSLARRQFFVAIKKRHLRFRLIRYLIKYEFVYSVI